METIIATKNGKKRSFTARTWELLGATKDGWVQMPDVEIKNIATKPTAAPSRPATGTNKRTAGGDQTVTNVAKQPAPDQVVTNTETPTGDDSESVPPVAPTEEQKAEFLKVAEGLNAGIIKDFFDGCTPPIAYVKKSSQTQLIKQLGEALGWNVVEFQKLFS